MDRCLPLKNPENVKEFTNIRRIFRTVVRHAAISYYDCEDSTNIIENKGFCEESRKACEESRKL